MDSRLRECNYGEWNRGDAQKMDGETLRRVKEPFPGGESYRDVEVRVRDFVAFLLDEHAGERVAVVSHRGPQLALEVICNQKSWEQAIREDWRNQTPKAWRAGWAYELHG